MGKMTTGEAIEICHSWFRYTDEQAKRSKRMQEPATQARKGPEEAAKAKREMNRLRGRGVTVFDGARLRPAVEHLISLINI